MAERNPSIELWRCFCMFAIIFGHVLGNNGVSRIDFLAWHVPGFLWITGYFGVRFTWQKVARLIGITYACYWMTIPFRPWTGVCALVLPHGGWFLPFYLVLMLLGPILENVFLKVEIHRHVFIALLGLLFISWLPALYPNNVHLGMLRIPGMSGNGLFMMMFLYIVPRLCKMYLSPKKETSKHTGNMFLYNPTWFSIMGLVLFTMVMSGLQLWRAVGGYLNPFALLGAGVGFYVFKNFRIPPPISRFCCWISPSMWSIYILHECCIRQYQISSFVTTPLRALVWSLGLFLFCLLLDSIRRILVWLFMTKIGFVFGCRNADIDGIKVVAPDIHRDGRGS